MTNAPLTTQQAAQALRAAGISVRPHGARFLVGTSPAETTALDAAQLIALAAQGSYEAPAGWTATCGSCGQQFIADAPIADGAFCPRCAASASSDAPTPIGALSNPSWPTLPMTDLFSALEAHAKRLGTLTPNTPIPVPRGLPDRLLVPIGSVVPGRYQPRTTFDEAELQELAESIREHGMLNPALVFANEKGDFELIAGERRLRAAHIVGLTMLPIEIRAYTLQQIAEISGVDNLQRAQLSALEKGRYFNRLIGELGISENALSKRLGMNRASIQQHRAIASAAPAIGQALEAQQITFSQARAVALAAPGDHAAQQKALKQLETWLSQGRKVTEGDALNATESAVLASATKKLEALGWTVTKNDSSTLIWAPGERPRSWTGAEMLTTIAEQRKPATTPPAAELAPAVLASLGRRYLIERTLVPWIGLADGYNEVPTFYAAAELPAIMQQLDAELAAITTQAAAQGWTFTPRGDRYFDLKHTDGAYRSVFSWNQLLKVMKELPKAQTTNTPASYTPPAKICTMCAKRTTAYTSFEEGTYCDKPCLGKAKKAAQQRKATAQAKIDAAIGPWLISAPPDALRLIFSMLGWRAWQAIGSTQAGTASARAEQLAALAPERLARGVATLMGEYFDDQRSNPFATFSPTTAHAVVLSFTAEEAAIFPGQAGRARELLNAEGYATVSDFVRVASAALTGTVSAADTEAPAVPDGSTTATPTPQQMRLGRSPRSLPASSHLRHG